MRSRAWVVLLLAIVFLIAPIAAEAQGIVPQCQGQYCQACDIISLGQNVINFFLGLTIPIVIGLFAYAGFLMFTSAERPEQRNKAKSIFRHALLGFLLALSSYLIVNTILHTILKDDYANGWNKIDCHATGRTDATIGELLQGALNPGTSPVTSGSPNSSAAATPTCRDGYSYYDGLGCYNETTGDIESPTNLTQTGGICSGTCVGLSIPNLSSSCAKASDGNCLVNAQTNAQISAMCNQLGGGCLGTAAIGGNHYATCQNSGTSDAGTCIDMVYQDCSMTSASCINKVVTAANDNGLRAVFETNNQTTYNAIQSSDPSLIANKSVIYIPGSHITGNHFSVYSQ